MLSTLRKIHLYSLYLMTACVFFSASVLTPLPVSAAPLQGKKIDLTYQNSSPQHYYSKIQLLPTTDPNDPACIAARTGMLYVDLKGNLLMCNGTLPENVTSPWETSSDGSVVFAKDFTTAQVAIGSNSIPNNRPLPYRPDLVRFYLAQSLIDTIIPLTQTAIDPATSNQIEFKPTDQNGNVTLEMYAGRKPSGTQPTSTYFNFMVGDAAVPGVEDWDGRIEYYYNSATVSGLKFIGQRKNTKTRRPVNDYPELRIYHDGRVDFGSDENEPPVPILPARNSTKVKVYGNTKADSVILDHDGVGVVKPPLPLKVKYNPAGGGGYYAIYAP